MENSTPTSTNRSSRNIAAFVWASSLVLGIIPGTIVYNFRSNDDYLNEQLKESINWNITAILLFVVGLILIFVFLGIVAELLLLFAHITFCVWGAAVTFRGKDFKVPYAIRMLK